MKPNTKALLKLTFFICLAFVMPLLGLIFGAIFLGGNIEGGMIVGTIVSVILYIIAIFPYFKNKDFQRTLLAWSVATGGCIVFNLMVGRIPSGFFIAFGFMTMSLGTVMPIAASLKKPQPTEPVVQLSEDGESLILHKEVSEKKAKKERMVNISLLVFFCALAVIVLVLNALPKSQATPEDMAQIFEENNPTCTVKNVTFPIQADWVPFPEKEGLFTSKDGSKLLGMNDATPLGGGDPVKIINDLVAQYEEQYTIHHKDTVTSLTTDDDVLCYTTELSLTISDGVDGYARILAVPQKNLLISFIEQWSSAKKPSSDTIRSATFDLSFEVGNENAVRGNTFVSQGDGSELCLKDDGSFYYYATENVHNEQYYIGTYECYYGQEAFDKIASMTDYGLTTESLEQLLSSNMNGFIPGDPTSIDSLYALNLPISDDVERYSVCKDTFYALILTNDKVVMSKDDIKDSGNTALYVGYYIPELKLLDLTNLNTVHYYGFELKGLTNTLDSEPKE